MSSNTNSTESKPYEVVIGLEVHVQLATETKLFCRCSCQYGAPPNTQTCPVCLGMPGSLPVMNREAFQLAMKTAIALNCEIPPFTKWDRKQYFYPDLPKGYQISQFDLPMSQNGWLEISPTKDEFKPKKVGITRAHLEDDAGKSMHDEVAGKADSRIDLNRTGTPLLEIVSEPDMRSAAEARAYLSELKLLLEYLGVSDCNMQEGSLRVDANINLHMQQGDQTIATPIVEVKNMNSFRAVERALFFEAARQYDEWQETGRKKDDPGVTKQTRGWDDAAEITKPQRSKEDSADYRYFPDPDLVPVKVTKEQVERVRASLGRLPANSRTELQNDYAISAYDAEVIVNQGRKLVEYFEAVAKKTKEGKKASNWIQQDVLRTLNENELTIDQFGISADALADIILAVADGTLDNSRARDVFAEMLNSESDMPTAMKKLGIEKVDDSAIDNLAKELLAANQNIVADVKAGKQQAVGALIGQAKKKNPNVNPGKFRETCLRLIAEM
ncbi:Asp-tRNA(Asn)/Glu-tRNA(Gln) amidotransferase subunit GatB [Planctomycetota bacterium]